MNRRLLILMASLNCLAVSEAGALTRRVPTQYPTIQGAISASAAGDTVLVLPGIYVENIFIDRDLALRSAEGPAVTVIDGSRPGDPDTASPVRMSEGVIEGFDIRGGTGTCTGDVYGRVGGGIYATGPGEIRANWIHDNTLRASPPTAKGYGGGVRALSPSERIAGNRIYNNRVESQEYGQAAGLTGGGYSSLIDGNEIYDNRVALGRAAGLTTRANAINNIIACNSVDIPYTPQPSPQR